PLLVGVRHARGYYRLRGVVRRAEVAGHVVYDVDRYVGPLEPEGVVERAQGLPLAGIGIYVPLEIVPLEEDRCVPRPVNEHVYRVVRLALRCGGELLGPIAVHGEADPPVGPLLEQRVGVQRPYRGAEYVVAADGHLAVDYPLEDSLLRKGLLYERY